jgi:hypothetical protein
MDTSNTLTAAAVFSAFLRCPTKAHRLATSERKRGTFFTDIEARISSMYRAVAKRQLRIGPLVAELLEFGQLWRSLTHTCRIRHATSGTRSPGSDAVEAWELTADVGNVPVGTLFEVIVETTYWNAFDTAAKQWYETYSNNQTQPEVLATLLIFPEGTPFKRFDLLKNGQNKSLQPFAGQSTIIPGAGNQSIYWEIPDAATNEVVGVNWFY